MIHKTCQKYRIVYATPVKNFYKVHCQETMSELYVCIYTNTQPSEEVNYAAAALRFSCGHKLANDIRKKDLLNRPLFNSMKNLAK